MKSILKHIKENWRVLLALKVLKIAVLLFITLLSSSAEAQNLTVSVSKNNVAVGERFRLTYSLNAAGSNFTPPAVKDFSVYGGPMQSSSTSIVNGRVSQSISYEYIIAAKKVGKFVIPPASMVVNGKKQFTKPVTITVTKSVQVDESTRYFIKTVVSKRNVYQGELIGVTYKVYSRDQLVGFQNIKFPDFTGYWRHDVSQQEQVNVVNENVGGINYQVATIQHVYLIPQQTGKLVIEPIMAECVVRKVNNEVHRNIFGMITRGGYEDVAVDAFGKPITINVKPLPAKGKPEKFTGAVGNYSFNAVLSKEKVKAHEGINLVVTIKGTGNIKLVEPLNIAFPADFELYDPKVTENISVTKSGVNGTKKFDYLLIPRHGGEYDLGDINFNYFDPIKKKYITLASPDFSIDVEQGDDNQNSAAVYSPTQKEDVEMLASDIRYIKTSKPVFHQDDPLFYGSWLYYCLLLAPFVVLIGFVVLRKRYIAGNSDAVKNKKNKAGKMAKKHLSLAEKDLVSNNKEQFYVELFKAINGYIADKFNLLTVDLSKENIAATLQKNNVSEGTISKLLKVIDECEYARYAPSGVRDDLKTVFKETTEIITQIENELA